MEIMCLVVMIGLIILGIVIMCRSGLELYRVIRYRDFGFNEDTFICGTVFLFGVLSLFMGISIWVV